MALYSTFLQRAYDQILHDVCMAAFRLSLRWSAAGLVGSDGETHQGIFDIAFLSQMPNLTVMAPKNSQELEDMFSFAFAQEGPVAIRYSRGAAYDGLSDHREAIRVGRSEWIHTGRDIAVIAVGSMLKSRSCGGNASAKGIRPTLINADLSSRWMSKCKAGGSTAFHCCDDGRTV